MIKVTSTLLNTLDATLVNRLNTIKSEVINNPPEFSKEIYQLNKVLLEFKKIDNIKNSKDTLVIIGVGGSDLGFRAIFNALEHSYYNELNIKNSFKKVYFCGDTTESRSLNELLDILDLSKTLFLVISKSGNTIETLSSFLFFYTKVKLQNLNVRDHFVFLTDELNDTTSNTLRNISLEKDILLLNIPLELGGRFSVLSSVGLIPSLLLDLDINNLFKGAIDLDNHFKAFSSELDEVSKYVMIIYLEYLKGKDINVIFPYSKYLTYFSKWYVQLISESLGKRDTQGIQVGITPISNIGPIDQHSSLQLYVDGIKDKVITFIKVLNTKYTNDIKLNNIDINELSFLNNKSFNGILNLELESSLKALNDNEVSNVSLEIEDINEYNLSQLFYFFELVTLMLSKLLYVNAFDQPGIVDSKKFVSDNLKNMA